ncbi:MAG TPA: exodeoxyribonuclease VII small subunit [Lapillicoccus sp.]
MGAREVGPSGDGVEFADVAELSYENARDELTAIVAQLEGGQVPLEEGMRLWRRGEALAAHCTAWLDGAQRQISEAGPASTPS